MINRKQRPFAFVAVMSLMLALSASASALGLLVYGPSAAPGGKSYSTHAADFWKLVLKQPVAHNPLLDTTGADCAVGQSGLLSTWYLFGAPDNSPVIRSCAIPYGRTIVFPVFTAFYGAVPSDSPAEKTVSYVRSQVTYAANATNLEVEVDGQRVSNLGAYLEKSDVFSVTLPADNLFGAAAGTVVNPAVDQGFYVGLAPLAPGQHTVHFHSEYHDADVDQVQDVTYNLTIRLLPF